MPLIGAVEGQRDVIRARSVEAADQKQLGQLDDQTKLHPALLDRSHLGRVGVTEKDP
jgi:hypothetical protein